MIDFPDGFNSWFALESSNDQRLSRLHSARQCHRSRRRRHHRRRLLLHHQISRRRRHHPSHRRHRRQARLLRPRLHPPRHPHLLRQIHHRRHQLHHHRLRHLLLPCSPRPETSRPHQGSRSSRHQALRRVPLRHPLCRPPLQVLRPTRHLAPTYISTQDVPPRDHLSPAHLISSDA